MNRSKHLLQELIERFKEIKEQHIELGRIRNKIEDLECIPKAKITFDEYTLKHNLQRYYDFKWNISNKDSSINQEQVAEIIGFEIAENMDKNARLNDLFNHLPDNEKEYQDLFNELLEEEYAKIKPMVEELLHYLANNPSLGLQHQLKDKKPKPANKATVEGLKDYIRDMEYSANYSPDSVLAYKYGVRARRY